MQLALRTALCSAWVQGWIRAQDPSHQAAARRRRCGLHQASRNRCTVQPWLGKAASPRCGPRMLESKHGHPQGPPLQRIGNIRGFLVTHCCEQGGGAGLVPGRVPNSTGCPIAGEPPHHVEGAACPSGPRMPNRTTCGHKGRPCTPWGDAVPGPKGPTTKWVSMERNGPHVPAVRRVAIRDSPFAGPPLAPGRSLLALTRAAPTSNQIQRGEQRRPFVRSPLPKATVGPCMEPRKPSVMSGEGGTIRHSQSAVRNPLPAVCGHTVGVCEHLASAWAAMC